jgi:periplasmic mercuric ion binding protein
MKLIIQLFIVLFFCKTSLAQSSVKTGTLKVHGVCGDCKDRIENAADIKGVKKCTWNKETKIATIVYDEKKVDMAKIEKAIAAVGYETEHEKGNVTAYKKLPQCCQYNDPSNKTH